MEITSPHPQRVKKKKDMRMVDLIDTKAIESPLNQGNNPQTFPMIWGQVPSMNRYPSWVPPMYGMGTQMYPRFIRIQVPKARITHSSQPTIILGNGHNQNIIQPNT
jgi:hypothetical protein